MFIESEPETWQMELRRILFKLIFPGRQKIWID